MFKVAAIVSAAAQEHWTRVQPGRPDKMDRCPERKSTIAVRLAQAQPTMRSGVEPAVCGYFCGAAPNRAVPVREKAMLASVSSDRVLVLSLARTLLAVLLA